MMNRMTDERLTEIEAMHDASHLWSELLQALKAERKRIAELEKLATSMAFEKNHQITKLQARLDAVAAGYREAIEDIESWAAYADDYFQKKHDLAGTLARHKAALEDKK